MHFLVLLTAFSLQPVLSFPADTGLATRAPADPASSTPFNLKKRVIDPNRYDGIFRVPQNVILLDNRVGGNGMLSEDDEMAIRDAWAHARILAQFALEVQQGDPLLMAYFGTTNNYGTVMGVFRAIRDFDPDQLNAVTIERAQHAPGTNQDIAEHNHGRTTYNARRITLFESWFGLQQFGDRARRAGPGPDPDARPMHRDLGTQGAQLLHELIHLVTHMNPGTVAAPRDALAQAGFQNPPNRVTDIRPSRYIITQNDQVIVDGMGTAHDPRAYEYEQTTGLARMQYGRYLTLLNVNNYVQFAIAAMFNRRHIVGVTPQTVMDSPTAWAGLGQVWSPRHQIFALEVFQMLCALLQEYYTRNQLGKVPPNNIPPRKREAEEVSY